MRKCFVLFLILPMMVPAQQVKIGAGGGYFGGANYQLFAEVNGLTSDAPLALRLAAEYSVINPGNAPDARRIFVNNATNGVPDKSGRIWNLRADAVLPVKIGFLPNARVFAGVRRADYLGQFEFIGGNEIFEIHNTAWGLGGGLETLLSINGRWGIQFSAGLDYYFDGVIDGHDTAYSPDNDNINPRENFKYEDADKAINQPQLEWRFQVGFAYSL